MIKKFMFYSLLLISPFALIIGVNEYYRPKEPYIISNFGRIVPAYNSDVYFVNKCSWHCHSKGCFHNHVICKDSTIISSFYRNILKLNGIDTIQGEKKSTRGTIYKTMTIITLVVLWPLLMVMVL